MVNSHCIKWMILGAFLAMIAFTGQSCTQEESTPQTPVVYRKIQGEVQILNACGVSGAAGEMRDFLIQRGFDVVELGNNEYWNFEETIIALRNPEWMGAEPLANMLQTDNIIPLQNPVKLVDATVYVGKNYRKIIHD